MDQRRNSQRVTHPLEAFSCRCPHSGEWFIGEHSDEVVEDFRITHAAQADEGCATHVLIRIPSQVFQYRRGSPVADPPQDLGADIPQTVRAGRGAVDERLDGGRIVPDQL